MATKLTPEQARDVLDQADLLFSAEQVAQAVDEMAAGISRRLHDCDPLIVVVMNGALMPASQLVTRLNFPLQLSYVHVTRYRGDIRGGQIQWVARPNLNVEGRTVLVVDDIYDEGHTLKAIVDDLNASGADAVLSAVLVNKLHERKGDSALIVDFVGLNVPDRYVFGCGMDYHEYWRNLPAIYAINS